MNAKLIWGDIKRDLKPYGHNLKVLLGTCVATVVLLGAVDYLDKHMPASEAPYDNLTQAAETMNTACRLIKVIDAVISTGRPIETTQTIKPDRR